MSTATITWTVPRCRGGPLKRARLDLYNSMAEVENGSFSGDDVNASIAAFNRGAGVNTRTVLGTSDPQQMATRYQAYMNTSWKYGLSMETLGKFGGASVNNFDGSAGMISKGAVNPYVKASQLMGVNSNDYLEGYLGLQAQTAGLGLTTDRDAQSDFALRLASSGVGQHQAMNIPKSFAQDQAGARKSLTQGFSGAGQQGILAYALSKTGSYEDAIDYVSGMSEQEQLSAMRQTLGDDVTRLNLMDSGLSKKQANSLIGTDGKALSELEYGGMLTAKPDETHEGVRALESERRQHEATNQKYETTPEHEARMRRIDDLFDSIASNMTKIVDDLVKVVAG
jgi:hypothetical protein